MRQAKKEERLERQKQKQNAAETGEADGEKMATETPMREEGRRPARQRGEQTPGNTEAAALGAAPKK